MLDKVAHRDFDLLNTVHIPRDILFFFIFESRLHFMVDIIRYAEADLAHVIIRLSGHSLDELIVSQPLLFASHLKIHLVLDFRVVIRALL